MLPSEAEKLWRASAKRVVFRADGGIFTKYSVHVYPLEDRNDFLWCLWSTVPQMTIGRIIAGDACPTVRSAVAVATSVLLAQLEQDNPDVYAL